MVGQLRGVEGEASNRRWGVDGATAVPLAEVATPLDAKSNVSSTENDVAACVQDFRRIRCGVESVATAEGKPE